MLKNLRKFKVLKAFNLLNVERRTIFILTVLVFIVANILIAALSLRLDLSYGKAYTLSPATDTILRNIDDIVTIKFFASSELPTRLQPLKTEVTDLLNEYKKVGGHRLTVQILDPKKDEKAALEAKEIGIPELRFSQIEQDRYAITAAQFGIVLSYSDKRELLPQVTDIESLEYNLTAAIYKMVRKDLPKIGIMGPRQAFNPAQDQFRSLKQILERQFTIESVEISTDSASQDINPSVKALMVIDTNNKQFNDTELSALRTYIKKKGNALFFVDGVWVGDNLSTTDVGHNLAGLLSDYGITVQNNLLLSTAAELVNFGDPAVTLMMPYPLWLKTNIFNPEVSYFSNVGQLTYPWTSSLTLSTKHNIKVEELIKTTKQSWEQKGTFTLDPQSIPPPQQSQLKQFVIGARSKEKDGGQIIVIPNSRFVMDRYISRNSGNLPLVLNILNEMASEGALSGISQRAVQFYPVPDLPETQKDLFKYANIFLLPTLFAIYGGLRLMRRR